MLAQIQYSGTVRGSDLNVPSVPVSVGNSQSLDAELSHVDKLSGYITIIP